MDKYEARFHAKRAAGISARRRDGSFCDPETDRQAGHAEEFAARELRAVVNDSVTTSGDPGFDFEILVDGPSGRRRVRVEAIWNGFATGSKTKPRLFGNLLVNPFEPHRYRESQIFVLVVGTIESGFRLVGWATRRDIEARPQRDFGFGKRYWVPMSELRSMDKLKTVGNGEAVSEMQCSSV